MRLLCRLAAVAALFLVTGCLTRSPVSSTQDDATPITVDVARLITVKAGRTVVIRLGSNPSTGYSWEVVAPSLGDTLSVVGKTTYTPDPAPDGSVGGAGTETITLLAKKPGDRLVSFAYRRPGDHKAGRRVVLEFNVL